MTRTGRSYEESRRRLGVESRSSHALISRSRAHVQASTVYDFKRATGERKSPGTW